jgi:hypothetical protein
MTFRRRGRESLNRRLKLIFLMDYDGSVFGMFTDACIPS